MSKREGWGGNISGEGWGIKRKTKIGGGNASIRKEFPDGGAILPEQGD